MLRRKNSQFLNITILMRSFVFQDWAANYSNPTKGKYVVVLFRLAQYIKKNRFSYYLFFWYLLLYRIIVEWFMCIELSWNTEIGPGFQIYHGSGLVIHPKVRIGENCKIRQCCTIGVRQDENYDYNDNAPFIGDNVDIGCNTVIIGPVLLGNDVVIGAGSVVVKSLPSGSVAVGNPARIIRNKN